MNTSPEVRPAWSRMARASRWFAWITAVIIVPKCILCVLAYSGVAFGAATVPELCGGSDDASARSTVNWTAAALLLITIGIVVRSVAGLRGEGIGRNARS